MNRKDYPRLSQTRRAQKWLRQFDREDQSHAGRLLDGLRYTSPQAITRGLHSEIDRAIKDGSQATPILPIPIMSLEDLDPLRGDCLPSAAIAFRDFDPFQRLSSAPGSEATIAQLIRNLRRSKGARRKLMKSPKSMNDLKDRKVRTLLFLTDYIGSGTQVDEYVKSWWRHPSIKSWHSLGLIRFVVLTYATTVAGRQFVAEHSPVDELIELEYAPDVWTAFSASDGEQVRLLCEKYGRSAGLGSGNLGYKDSGGLFVSSLSIPNNLPAILIKWSKLWTPFFDGRSEPGELVHEASEYHPARDLSSALKDVNRLRLARAFEGGYFDDRWTQWVAVLSLISEERSKICLELGIKPQELDVLINDLRRMDLLEKGSNETSAAGRALLRRAAHKPRKVQAGLQGSPSLYYPELHGEAGAGA